MTMPLMYLLGVMGMLLWLLGADCPSGGTAGQRI